MTTIFKEDLFGASQGQNATPHVERLSSFCPNCHIAQTYIQGRKKLTKEFDKTYVKYVFEYINNNNIKIFTKKQLMDGLNINHISDGVLQDRALSILIMLGHIRRENQEYIDDKGKLKIRSIYIKQSQIKPPICYDINKDKHIDFNWFLYGYRVRFKERGEKDGTNN